MDAGDEPGRDGLWPLLSQATFCRKSFRLRPFSPQPARGNVRPNNRRLVTSLWENVYDFERARCFQF
jgi:hypothetical protein